MDRTTAITWVLLSLCSAPMWAKPPEYQLDSEPLSLCERLRSESGLGPGPHCTVDGHFSPVQCGGGQCWCVDSEGQEVSGTRTSASAPFCPTRCQLQSDLRCSSSGQFEAVQCDSSRGQCWCVDQDGMELYGTRQNGRPQKCPGSCEVRTRRLLHSSSPHSAPQCSTDGSFLSVQCKLINSTDRRELDLTSTFNRFPEAFETFSNFRSVFPSVSSYCFCSDSRGRELKDTGLELLMTNVYDSAFSGIRSGRSFSESNVYKVLQRRLLGVRLVLTGNFRCPTPCEALRGAASDASSSFVPSCAADGVFSPTQCQQGAQCWCVDPEGRELPGTRRSGASPKCGPVSDCPSLRRLSLHRLFFGQSPPPLSSVAPGPASCSQLRPLLQTLSDLLPVQTRSEFVLNRLVQVLDGLFPSVGGALEALGRALPQRFQENLFGGRFLKNTAGLNFTGALGPKGLDWIRAEDRLIQTHQDLVQSISKALEDPGFLSALQNILRGLSHDERVTQALTPLVQSCSDFPQTSSDPVFVPSCTASGGFSPVQCRGEVCWCVDSEGRELERTRTRGRPRCPSKCESQRSAALRLKGALSAGAELHIPACSEDGRFLALQCVGAKCFCVDEEGRTTAESATSCLRATEKPQPSPGRCSVVLAEVTAFKQEVMSLVSLSNSSRFPLGYGFLLAKALRFTSEELGQSETPLINNRLLSRSNAALRLAAVSVYQQLVAPEKQILQTFSPQCDSNGNWIPTQCHLSTGQCWCVGEDGLFLPGTLTNRRAPKCPTHCQRARTQTLLSDWLKGSDITTSSGPQCEDAPPPQLTLQPLQTQTLSQTWSWVQSCSRVGSIGSRLLNDMTSRGLCSVQLPLSRRSVSICGGSTFELWCEQDSVRLTLTWTLDLSDLGPEDLPDLHKTGVFLNESAFLRAMQGILGKMTMASQLRLVSKTSARFGCFRGFSLDPSGKGCWPCAAGNYSNKGECLLCPAGTYQDQEGRDFCVTCPRGSSETGASSVSQCVTECQRRGLRCSESGDFLPAQPDFMSGTWRCVDNKGAELQWTNSVTALTDKECTVMSSFKFVPFSEVVSGAEDSQILRAVSSDLKTCLKECAVDSSCHHVALFSGQTQCELYSTASENTLCNSSPQIKGFLGNPEAELFQSLHCSVKLRSGASDLQVYRKKGDQYSSGSGLRTGKAQYSTSGGPVLKKAESGVYRTQVFSSNQSSLPDVQRFCLSTCRRDPCCEGFVLNQNKINSGSIMCGYLSAPPVLMCSDQDWDVIGRGAANRECGVGLIYNERQGNFLFEFGGQRFTFSSSDANLTKEQKGYQVSLVNFSAVHINNNPMPDLLGSGTCPSPESGPAVDPSVLVKYRVLSEEDVAVDPEKKQPSLTFWFNRKNYNSQQALLSCLSRCDSEPLCSVVDLLDLGSGFFSCELFPDSRVCGAYDKPLRSPCRPLLHRAPNNTYSKIVDLSGPVKSFYQRVPFQKMVSYSVRSRVSVGENTPLSQGFRVCERRCDEDHCCRGFGFVRDTKSGSGFGLVCLSLISLGVQTCSEESKTTWTTQDCGPSEIQTRPDPLGWYLKPVNQWSPSPGLCPDIGLPKTSVSRDQWSPVSGPAHLLTDPTLSTYDIIHLSRDITKDQDQTRDWCLHVCQESESCFAVSVSVQESGVWCVLYPDTRVCGLSSAPGSSSPVSSCQLIIREPAPDVYVRIDRLKQPESVLVPGHGTLRGRTVTVALTSHLRAVVQFLGVPYARPPIGVLRFTEAQPSDWTGDWDASESRPSCVEPGDLETSGSSEDCLYLNIFSPAALTGPAPVLVYFYNPPGPANESAALLDGSLLAALGNMVVVTAHYRSAALGFALGNYGLSDQEEVLRWVSAHIGLVGGAKDRVTVGSERQGADITSLHLSSPGSPLFNQLILMGGSVFSPALTRSESETRRLTFDLARELGCDLSGDVTRCLRAADVHSLNAAQTRLLALSGPLRSWGPVQTQTKTFHRVDLLLGTSDQDGLISRARRIKDFEDLAGRGESKSVFYEALSRSLGGSQDQDLLKEAASWFYSLDHSPNPASYNLFSRALNNATRDLFVVCPSLKMAQHWAQSRANVYLYHLPSSPSRADVQVPLDVQLLFGEPHRPISSERFTSSERRLSLSFMTYVSSFVRNRNPNPSSQWPDSALTHWGRVLPSEKMPSYLELGPAPKNLQGLRLRECSFWNELAPRLRGDTGAEPVPVTPPLSALNQSQPEKESYS